MVLCVFLGESISVSEFDGNNFSVSDRAEKNILNTIYACASK